MEVHLLVYDLSRGLARSFAPLLGLPLDLVPHTGVLLDSVEEVFYGGGVNRMRHAEVVRNFGLSPARRQLLGRTQRSWAEIHAFLESVRPRFTPATYDLFSNNCNTFSDVFAKFLVGTGVPADILELPGRVLSTPLGPMLRDFWTRAQSEMQTTFVPFNAGGGSGTSTFGDGEDIANVPSAEVSIAGITTPSRTTSTTSPPPTLVGSLKTLESSTNQEDYLKCTQTILTILQNISQNPYEERYRQVRLTNERFQRDVGRFAPHSLDVLRSTGFVENGDFLTLTPSEEKWNKLQLAIRIITSSRNKRASVSASAT